MLKTRFASFIFMFRTGKMCLKP